MAKEKKQKESKGGKGPKHALDTNNRASKKSGNSNLRDAATVRASGLLPQVCLLHILRGR